MGCSSETGRSRHLISGIMLRVFVGAQLTSRGCSNGTPRKTIGCHGACPWDVDYFHIIFLPLLLGLRLVAKPIHVVGVTGAGFYCMGSRGICSDSLYYISHSHEEIAERWLEILNFSPRHVCPAKILQDLVTLFDSTSGTKIMRTFKMVAVNA